MKKIWFTVKLYFMSCMLLIGDESQWRLIISSLPNNQKCLKYFTVNKHIQIVQIVSLQFDVPLYDEFYLVMEKM